VKGINYEAPHYVIFSIHLLVPASQIFFSAPCTKSTLKLSWTDMGNCICVCVQTRYIFTIIWRVEHNLKSLWDTYVGLLLAKVIYRKTSIFHRNLILRVSFKHTSYRKIFPVEFTDVNGTRTFPCAYFFHAVTYLEKVDEYIFGLHIKYWLINGYQKWLLM
jgi:hypothetical protein